MQEYQVVCLSDGSMAAAPTASLTPLRLMTVDKETLSKSSSSATLTEKDLPTSRETDSRTVTPFFLGNWEAAGFPTITSNCPSPNFLKPPGDDKSRAESPTTSNMQSMPTQGFNGFMMDSRSTTPVGPSMLSIFSSRAHSPAVSNPIGIAPGVISGQQYLLVPTGAMMHSREGTASPLSDGPTLVVPKLVPSSISFTSPFASQESHEPPNKLSVAPSRSSAFKPISRAEKLDKDDKEWEPKEEIVRERPAFVEVGEHKKPTASYARLIAQALTEAPDRKMRLRDIYDWFSENHPYFKPKDESWKNSVRHNLSLNKCFVNIPSEGTKGGQWTIDETVAAGFAANGSIPPTRPQRRRNRKSTAKSSRNDSAVEVMEWSQDGDGLAALAEAAARNDE